ncbi:Maf family protein [Gracilimonas sp. Q87]|uniref:Maf family protein n=1 Tax=Gracilimonas sp. Q87 TaxID=3384766 RepID=UPI0039842921
MQVILASQSPRRKKLLEQIGLKFQVLPSSISEETDQSDPIQLVEDLAQKKALDVAELHSDSLVIGSDTIVVHNDQILGKPKIEQDAIEMLKNLSGSTHIVYTGVGFIRTDKNGMIIAQHVFYEQTKVTFSSLDESDILAYVNGGSPMDKAGAYGIQDDMGALFVEKIEGDYYNVVGFPLNRFYRELKQFSPDIKFYGQ